jgi:hypothetical protein
VISGKVSAREWLCLSETKERAKLYLQRINQGKNSKPKNVPNFIYKESTKEKTVNQKTCQTLSTKNQPRKKQ